MLVEAKSVTRDGRGMATTNSSTDDKCRNGATVFAVSKHARASTLSSLALVDTAAGVDGVGRIKLARIASNVLVPCDQNLGVQSRNLQACNLRARDV